MKHLMAFVLFGSFLLLSENSQAAFRGCHQWCGNEGNKAWWNVLRSHGLNENSSRSEKAPYTREADAAKESKYWECMDQTLAEGKTSDADCNGVPSNDLAPAVPVANPNRCESEYQNAVAQCDSAIASAKTSCDSSRNAALNQGSSSASTNSQSSGITDSCGNVVTVATEAKNAWTSFRDQCSGGVDSCHSQCNAVMDWANNNPSCLPLTSGGRTITREYIAASVYSPRADQCMDLQAKVDSANSTIASYGRTSDSASECKTQTDGGESTEKSGTDMASLLGQAGSVAASLLAAPTTATPQAVATFCTANPSYPGCGASAQASCSDPAYAASNKVCQCAANPNSCRVVETGSGTVNLASIDSASRLPNNQNASLDGDLPSTPGIEMGPRPQGGDAPGIDGRQGGAPVGSSTVGSGGGAPSKANVDPNESNAQAGSLGTFGGSGGSASGRFGANAAGSKSYVPGSGGRFTGTPGRPGNPDLRRFLPGGSAYIPQGSMMGGRVGIDGITGPNSNIWQKVQNRYRVLKDTLHP